MISTHHKKIKNNPERILKSRPYINIFNWENINFPPQKQDFKTFEMNNESIALNILQVEDQEKISHYYKSKYNKTREHKLILLMITGNEKQHYFAVKRLNGLPKKKKGHSGEVCINCLKLFVNKCSSQNHSC